jgi:hypothetical protein
MQDNKDKQTSMDEAQITREYERSPGGGEISRARPDWPWNPPSFPYNGYRVSSPGSKRLGCGVNNPLPSSAEVKERAELYLYFPCEPSWPVIGQSLSYFYTAALYLNET